MDDIQEIIPFGKLVTLDSHVPVAPQAPVTLSSQEETLTKAQLSGLLFEQVGLNKREARDMVEVFFDEITRSLEQGIAVKISGFGNFELRDKALRPGRNPKTGEQIQIAARRVVTFHASQKLKHIVDIR